ncbi:hypothetical protein Pvag_pPag10017 (plasmid) [Pantoea vagans C9-1]|nr:hypothetical protein Pvag_pPag10017 [Pantoea vagans C9-1]
MAGVPVTLFLLVGLPAPFFRPSSCFITRKAPRAK